MAKASQPWKDKIIHHAAVGGIETSVLDNGPGRNTRIAWVNTGSGLRYKVVVDRGLDIVDCFYNEHSIGWFTHAGVTGPNPAANRGLEWLYSFSGGMLTTCGLSHIGGPEANDEIEPRGLHGRISNLPAEVGAVQQPDINVAKTEMSISGVMKETRLFGPNLELRRTITSPLGEAVIKVTDVVVNCGNASVPHMLLYHCNFGWPLVDEGTEILWKGTCASRGMAMDDALFASKHNYRKCSKPMADHSGGGESCGFIDVKADRKGMCTVGLYNPKLKLGLQMRYAKKQLPWLTNWQHWGAKDYVTALEPGTNPPIGQNQAGKDKTLTMLKPGQQKTYELEFTILTDAGAIKSLREQK